MPLKSRPDLKFVHAVFAAWTLFALSSAAISYFAAVSENRAASAWLIFSTNLLRFYLWLPLAPLIFQFVKQFDVKRLNSVFKSALAHLPLGLLFAACHSLIYLEIMLLFDDSYRQRYSSIVKIFQDYSFFAGVYLGMILYALIVITMQAWLFFREFRAAEARGQILQTQLAEARLQALKMQLQPHFLFNTLHSISSLSLIDPKRANLMVARLGEFLRMTLDRSDEQIIALDEELAFLRCYLDIEQKRFSDRLTVEFDVPDETLAASVPLFSTRTPIYRRRLKPFRRRLTNIFGRFGEILRSSASLDFHTRTCVTALQFYASLNLNWYDTDKHKIKSRKSVFIRVSLWFIS